MEKKISHFDRWDKFCESEINNAIGEKIQKIHSFQTLSKHKGTEPITLLFETN